MIKITLTKVIPESNSSHFQELNLKVGSHKTLENDGKD